MFMLSHALLFMLQVSSATLPVTAPARAPAVLARGLSATWLRCGEIKLKTHDFHKFFVFVLHMFVNFGVAKRRGNKGLIFPTRSKRIRITPTSCKEDSQMARNEE